MDDNKVVKFEDFVEKVAELVGIEQTRDVASITIRAYAGQPVVIDVEFLATDRLLNVLLEPKDKQGG